ncbi:MAG TPA: low specificity L-threonine aldolase, partial [Actinomycetes bacterium]|nr:low specificity L-threonine aldolase [Actinomycetes bacterium]
VETNIVVVATDDAPGVVARAKEEGVLFSLLDPTHLRAVTHLDVDDEAVGTGAEVLGRLLAG